MPIINSSIGKRRGRPPTKPESVAKRLQEEAATTTDVQTSTLEDIEKQWKQLRDPDFLVKNNVYSYGVMFYGTTDYKGEGQSGAKQGKPSHNIEAALYLAENRTKVAKLLCGSEQGAVQSADKHTGGVLISAYGPVSTSNGTTIAVPRLIRREDTTASFQRLTITDSTTEAMSSNEDVREITAHRNGNLSTVTDMAAASLAHPKHPLLSNVSIINPLLPSPADTEFHALHAKIRGAILSDIIEDDEIHGRQRPKKDDYCTAQKLLRISKFCCVKAANDAYDARVSQLPFPSRGETARGLAFLQSVGAPLSLLNLWTEHHNIHIDRFADVSDGLYDDAIAEVLDRRDGVKGLPSGFAGRR